MIARALPFEGVRARTNENPIAKISSSYICLLIQEKSNAEEKQLRPINYLEMVTVSCGQSWWFVKMGAGRKNHPPVRSRTVNILTSRFLQILSTTIEGLVLARFFMNPASFPPPVQEYLLTLKSQLGV